jgi:16S rRNA (uracil1498-N3)-methyltransferase
MNLILLSDPDFVTPDRVRLSGRRFLHIRDVLKPDHGQNLIVGKINGLIGEGTLIGQTSESIELEVKFKDKPPKALPLTLILALPRPPMLKRILFSAAMLGVKKIIILNFNRVEKSLWNSSSLKAPAITEQLVLGLEQAKDTVMPEVVLKKGFKPFVEDELPDLIKGRLALVAHPDKELNIPSPWWGGQGRGDKEIVLVIGPEGGIIDFEIASLKTAGCKTIDLGPRILRTEYVLPYVVGRLFNSIEGSTD